MGEAFLIGAGTNSLRVGALQNAVASPGNNWVKCVGQVVHEEEYPELYAAMEGSMFSPEIVLWKDVGTDNSRERCISCGGLQFKAKQNVLGGTNLSSLSVDLYLWSRDGWVLVENTGVGVSGSGLNASSSEVYISACLYGDRVLVGVGLLYFQSGITYTPSKIYSFSRDGSEHVLFKTISIDRTLCEFIAVGNYMIYSVVRYNTFKEGILYYCKIEEDYITSLLSGSPWETEGEGGLHGIVVGNTWYVGYAVRYGSSDVNGYYRGCQFRVDLSTGEFESNHNSSYLYGGGCWPVLFGGSVIWIGSGTLGSSTGEIRVSFWLWKQGISTVPVGNKVIWAEEGRLLLSNGDIYKIVTSSSLEKEGSCVVSSGVRRWSEDAIMTYTEFMVRGRILPSGDYLWCKTK